MAKLYKIVLMLVFFLLVAGTQSARAQWVQNGVPVCTASGGEFYHQAVADGLGGAIIVWEDARGIVSSIYAQKIASDGSLNWAANAVAICAAGGSQIAPQLASDGAGGAVIVWQDWRASLDIYAQRVNASGLCVWSANGVAICAADSNQYWPQLTSDGSGGAIIAWMDKRSGDFHLYAQRVAGDGSTLWQTDGEAIDTGGLQVLSPPVLTTDGSGGAIIVWEDYAGNIYAQRVAANGSPMWTTGGVLIFNGSGPLVVSDGASGAIIVWEDTRNGAFPDIYAQRVGANGTAIWTANGVPICNTGKDVGSFEVALDDLGGAIITWQDERGSSVDIYAQRVGADGSVMWTANGVPICTESMGDFSPQLASDGLGGAIITWEDGRLPTHGIYAQKVAANGSMMWQVNGVPICTAGAYPLLPEVTTDGWGGGIVTWVDERSPGSSHIYAQRINATGHIGVATLLQNYAATFSDAGIALTWTLSEIDKDAEFFVERSTVSTGPFIELPLSTLTRNGLSFSFIDKTWEPNTSYWYQVGYSIGSERKALFESGPVATPTVPLTLYQNIPNPFNPSTEIRYYLPEKCSVTLKIYDVNGALVANLLEGYGDKGTHAVSWDGRDRNGRQMSSGVYFYRLKAGKTQISKKMVLAR